ncbi:hypothetical protein BCR42DRAFT_394934 [Absidia repens]|uniref:Uncharacterized protein n=1 Tax=Absidia repens TaxID=90262 RepID=A0A1X2I8T9_9FUNG|nr:hypothetical protein BCR42DRAFT_394934 [Absidia repens]
MDLFQQLVADEGGILANKNIDIRLYFINSMKTQDVRLECFEESKGEDKQFKISERKVNLIGERCHKASLLSVAYCKLHISTRLLEILMNILYSRISYYNHRFDCLVDITVMQLETDWLAEYL